MKILIAGAGEVGTYLIKMLSVGEHDIIVVDTDDNKMEQISQQFDVLTVHGSCTSIATLESANIGKTDLFIAITEREEANITAAILAKRMGARKTIARVNNVEYIQAVNSQYFKSLGIDSLIYPEILAAREVVRLIQQTGSIEMGDFAGGKLSLYVIKLEESAPLANKTLSEAADLYKEFLYRAVAISRNGQTIIPMGSDSFLPGDLVYVITNQNGVEELMKSTGKKQIDIKNVMILGGSRIGVKTANFLQNQMNIKLLEIDREKCHQISEHLSNTLIINTDGRDLEQLKEEGLERMDAFIAVTGNSETNILACLIAKRMGVKRTIAEIENIAYVDVADKIGIDTIINKKSIAAGHIFSFTMSAEVSAVQCLTGTDAEVLEFVVHRNARITKGPLKSLGFPKDAVIGGVVRNNKSFIARGNSTFIPFDRVVIFALPSALNKVIAFFK